MKNFFEDPLKTKIPTDFKDPHSTLLFGDCLDRMKEIPDNSIDMVFTSPPYAEQRKTTYRGTPDSRYVQWFLPLAQEIKRSLKPTGSFFLNIKPHTQEKERVLYVFDLVLALKREIGFYFVDELCWTKNAFPGAFQGRFKNGFEPIYHFSKTTPNNIIFNPTACGTPTKKESIARANRKQGGKPKNGSKMAGINRDNLKKLKITRPSNVIRVHNVSNQYTEKQIHPATFPSKLVEFFIRSYTHETMTVCDPFMGSGTTGIVAKDLNRKFVGIELDPYYYNVAEQRIKKQLYLY